jgi:hypothetical protein
MPFVQYQVILAAARTIVVHTRAYVLKWISDVRVEVAILYDENPIIRSYDYSKKGRHLRQ